MEKLEDLESFLRGHVEAPNFTALELCTLRKTPGKVAIVPPRVIWPNILNTLEVAQWLRDLVGPLDVSSGYRPADYNAAVGGAKHSQHIWFRAIDLNLPASHEIPSALREAACKVWLDIGDKCQLGIGFYSNPRRVHIDTGHRQRYWKPKYVDPILAKVREMRRHA